MNEQDTARSDVGVREPGQIRSLVGHVSWLLGERRRWALLLPALSVVAAGAELVLLVSIVRSLLALVDDAESVRISLGVIDLELSVGSLLWLAAAAAVTSIVLRGAESAVVGRLAARAASTARSRVIRSYFDADQHEVASLRSGRLQQLLGANVVNASQAVPLLGTILAALISLTLYGTFVALSSPFVAAVFATLGLAILVLFRSLRRRTRTVAAESQRQVRDIQLQATSLVALNRELQLFDVQAAARDQLLAINDQARGALARLRTVQRLVPALFQQTVLLAIVGVIAIAVAVDLDAAGFGTASILAVRSLSYLQQLNTAVQQFLESAPYLDELRDAVRDHDTMSRARGDLELESVEEIELRDVGFAYGDHVVLHHVDLRVRRGEWLGIVGPSGGGKTTLSNVLAGLLVPSSGAYEVDGRAGHEYTARSWASSFALLSQEPTLIRGTIEENIRFFRDGDLDDVRAAARAAAIEADVEALDQGWSTMVGDGLASLSGGQRQRIALARALFGHPQVLILDEPTSALDAENSRLIEASLAALGPSAIVIVVSHRPELLSSCGRFVVVEDGRIRAEGTGDEIDLADYVGRIDR